MRKPSTSKVAPWLGFAAAVWVQIAAGNTYSFPLYSNWMKTVMNYDQTQLNNMGVAVDIGENVGILAGFFCNRIPTWGILCIGSSFCFFGYGTLWLVLSGIIAPLPYWAMWIAQLVGANSVPWLITAVLVTNMRNFPLSRGTVSGILKGLSGLGGAVFTQVFTGFLSEDPNTLLLFLTIGPLVICFVVMYFVKPCVANADDDTKEQKHLTFIQLMTITLAVYLLVTSIATKVIPFDIHLMSKLFVVLMLLLMLSPIIVPIQVALEENYWSRQHLAVSIEAPKEPLLKEQENLQDPKSKDNEIIGVSYGPSTESRNGNGGSTSVSGSPQGVDEMDNDLILAAGAGAIVRKKRKPRRGEDFNLKQAMVRIDFWLLFLAFFCGVGSGITVLNNLAQIGLAEGYENITILLSIIGVCNFFGRLGGGVLSEYYVRKSLIPRTVWMVISQILMVFAFLFFATSLPGSLHICAFVLGGCYGMQFAVMVPTASEIFGLKHFGLIYNFQTMGNPLGAFLFSVLLAGYLYDKEVEKQTGHHPSDHSHACIGPSCFRLTFIIMAGVCSVGVVLSSILTVRIWPVYEKLYGNASFRIQRS